MAWGETEFKYEFDPEFDFILEEKANTYIALRKVKWGNSQDFKVDIRKYMSSENGEQMRKGCTFISEEGVHELTKVLLQQGYGRTDEIVSAIKNERPKVFAALIQEIKDIPIDKAKEMVDEALADQEEFYDLREVI